LAAAVHEELEAGRVLLLLDGLDEVVGSTSRQQVVRAVQAFAKAYPACRLVVTCRVRAYEGAPNQAWQLPGWPTATLADWTVGQMQHFVQAWYGAAAASSRMSGEKRDERVTALKGAIERRGDLKRLGVRPLLLTIMALVHFNDGQLPEERVGLYSRCVDLLLGQWELAKEDGSGYGKLTDYLSLPDTDVKVLRPLLQAAAFAAHEASTPDVPGSLGRDTLRLMVMEALAQKGHPNPFQGAKRFLEYTDVRSGLLQASDAGDAYTFPHLTFQEYLAGLELVREVDFVQHILARRDDDRWRVPIQLGVGHLVSEGALAMVYQLLSELVYLEGRSEEQHQRDLLFASDLAEDIGWGRLKSAGFTRLRRDLAHALVSVVEGTVLPARERVRAGTLLGGLGDPRIPITPEEWSIASAGGTTDPLHRYWCHVPPGTYVVGSCDDARDARDDEKPQHTVTIAYPFWIARYPITNAQWQAWVAQGGKPSYRADDGDLNHPNQPVVRVTWQMFNDFCFWLTDQMGGVLPAGYAVQLPTEAEWEAAARGGDGRRYPWGDEWQDDHATTEANRRDLGTGWSTPVGCYATGAAPCGALDMAGNVWEWTADVWRSHPGAAEPFKEQEYRVLKGGSYRGGRTLVRCATRVTYHHDLNLIDFGGRVVVSPRVRTSGRDE
jgi:formylglycine-generating enzyme required for sulfatase activity